MPALLARPERGLSCASYPLGSAIANPQGIKAIAPGIRRIVSPIAARTSIPADPLVSYDGSGMSSLPKVLLIGIEMSDLKPRILPQPVPHPKQSDHARIGDMPQDQDRPQSELHFFRS